MDAKPHTHQIVIGRQWMNGKGGFTITYGDTSTVILARFPFVKWRIERGIKRTIRKHDRGSIRAGKRVDKTEKARMIAAKTNASLQQNEWGSHAH